MSATRFNGADGRSYRFMPFRFGRLPDRRVLLSNDCGEFIALSYEEFEAFLSGSLPCTSPLFLDLKAKQFLTQGLDDSTMRVAASQWRTKKRFLEHGPKLHIFVPTLRCNQSCGYCQVSRKDHMHCGADMAEETASKAIDLMLQAPSSAVTMEFQGGEPLLAFDQVRWMVETAAERAALAGKKINFVVCTNLTLLTNTHLAFFARHNIAVSTSLDGPPEIHNRNRPLAGTAAYDCVVENIRRCQDALGPSSVSALMTATTHSLDHPQAIVDEYVKLGFASIFLRELNPYGFAAKSAPAIGYDVSTFITFYKRALSYIIDLNRQGISIAEGYATILLRKMLTPFGVGFVDLQSPTGEGFAVVLYNHDGSVYPSDEARMLAEMGDDTFRMGSVEDTYSSLFFGKTNVQLAAAGCAECLPGCSDCVFVPYCGADPIRHYRTQGDLFGHRPTSSFCKKQKALFQHLFLLLADGDPELHQIFLGWMMPSRKTMPRPQWLS
jgi:His-Xaa-Ser system radical SAM maturase HxsB